jgi:hypothetical protein
VGLKEGEEGCEGAPASDADGRSPREPGMILDSSERLKMIMI